MCGTVIDFGCVISRILLIKFRLSRVKSALCLILQESPSPPSHPHLHLFHHCIHIYIEKPKRHDAIMSHPTIYPKQFTLTPPFILTKAKLSHTHSLFHPTDYPPPSYVLNTCHKTSLLTLSYAFSRSLKPTYTLRFFSSAFLPICFSVKN